LSTDQDAALLLTQQATIPTIIFNWLLKQTAPAYAAPLGFLEAGAADFAGQIPLILKLNNHDSLQDEVDPLGAQTATVADALRLGCVGIGYTIYPGTTLRRLQYEQLREVTRTAKESGLVIMVWSYPRGADLSKEGETALDVTAYVAHIAAELGAHIIKVKLPSEHLSQQAARKTYEVTQIQRESMTDRVRHVVQAAFNGRRVIVFSGGGKEKR